MLELGPRVVVVKRGEYGSALYAKDFYFVTPAFPIDQVKDPTGAGDSFAGGFIGYLAASGTMDLESMKRAVVHGSVVASFTVEDFSIGRLKKVTRDAVERRYQEFAGYTQLDAAPSLQPAGQAIRRI